MVFEDIQQKNPGLALTLLGVFIGATATLNITGVFTSCWISDGQNCTGIVPFDSSEPAWLAASWLLLILVADMVIMIALYIVIVMKVLKRGHHITLRKWLNLLDISVLLNVVLIGASIAVFQSSIDSTQYVLGWSSWLTLTALAATSFIVLFRIGVQRECTVN
ncbi:hypothetical protein CRE_30479 [Caenorhabditis remanei]|uniref:G-protein coupled receptors family 1 profile domain-containing protein n=1 Tax=Caenorhabditis remanei TaxID=31234 RepID=E3NGJ7_CAERE|nr:hypothetical protein CRE_30479 [Caenorhabditis remanei]